MSRKTRLSARHIRRAVRSRLATIPRYHTAKALRSRVRKDEKRAKAAVRSTPKEVPKILQVHFLVLAEHADKPPKQENFAGFLSPVHQPVGVH